METLPLSVGDGEVDNKEAGQNVSSGSQTELQEEMDGLYWVLLSLYSTHFLARWGHSMWDFAVALFMVDVWPGSLLLSSIYGLVESAAIVSLGVPVGNWVDRTPHLKVLQISLVVGSGSIVAAGFAVLVLLFNPGSAPGGFPVFIALVVCTNFFGGLSVLGLLATDIVVERDWVVVISEQYGANGSGLLSKLNGVMRRIDLSCKLLAPVAVGFLMSSVSVSVSAIVIVGWNMLTVGFQYALLAFVYWSIPALQVRQPLHVEQEVQIEASTELLGMASGSTKYEVLSVEDEVEDEGASLVENDDRTRVERLRSKVLELAFIKSWGNYLNQEVVLAAVALATLYFTVLSFGPLMTAVLQLKGVPPYVLGVVRGIASLVGIAGTVAHPYVHSQLGTVRTGLWAIWIQWTFLSLCVVSTWLSSSTLSAGLLMGGVAASRIGLWMFDLAVTQMMQESVHEAERGTVGGVQSSLQSFMSLLTFVLTIVISHPQDFWIHICVSYLAVTTAACLYAFYTYRVRGHLFHFEKLLCDIFWQ